MKKLILLTGILVSSVATPALAQESSDKPTKVKQTQSVRIVKKETIIPRQKSVSPTKFVVNPSDYNRAAGLVIRSDEKTVKMPNLYKK